MPYSGLIDEKKKLFLIAALAVAAAVAAWYVLRMDQATGWPI